MGIPLNDADVSTVVDVLVSHGLAMLSALVDQGSTCIMANRAVMAWMLSALPVVCRQGRLTAAGEPAYAPVIWYERTRLGWVNRTYFLDGAPAALALFGAPIALEFPVTQMRDLLYDDVVDERMQTIVKLEAMPAGSAKRIQLASSLDQLPDMPPAVPQPVRFFVSRARSMCHGLRAAKSPTHFSQCQNDMCCRLFYKGERPYSEFGYPVCSIADEDESYWQACAPRPAYDTNPKRFCSAACGRQWTDHWQRLMPDDSIPYDADADVQEDKEEDRRRCAKAFERAIKRNGKATRAIRKRRKRHGRSCAAISRADANREFEARLDMLNVDTGLLYAAQLAAKLPQLARRRRLPGAGVQWRRGGEESHRNALIRVARIYQLHRTSEPISDLLNLPGFLRAVRSQVSSIF